MDAVTHKQKLKADGKPQEPYSKIMNAKLAQLQEEIALFTKMRAEDEDYWVSKLWNIILQQGRRRPCSAQINT